MIEDIERCKYILERHSWNIEVNALLFYSIVYIYFSLNFGPDQINLENTW